MEKLSSISSYRRKSEEVEAIQFTRDRQQKCLDFANGKLSDITIPRCIDGVMTGTINLFGENRVITEGEYIVKNNRGDVFLYDEERFDFVFEAVNIM